MLDPTANRIPSKAIRLNKLWGAYSRSAEESDLVEIISQKNCEIFNGKKQSIFAYILGDVRHNGDRGRSVLLELGRDTPSLNFFD